VEGFGEGGLMGFDLGFGRPREMWRLRSEWWRAVVEVED